MSFVIVIDWRLSNTFLESNTINVTAKLLELKIDQSFIMQLVTVIIIHILLHQTFAQTLYIL